MRDETNPDCRFAFVRQELAQIEHSWDALGLRGTGSHHLTLETYESSPSTRRHRYSSSLHTTGRFGVSGCSILPGS